MKLIKSDVEPVFQPITLVIETQEELDLLYHRFNCTDKETFDNYCKCRKFDYDDSVDFKMWIAFDNAKDGR